MRFPLALTAKIARHIIKHKLRRTPKFAMVLQLEPLHTCNLTCTGCGRIREYSTSLKDMMSLEDCLGAATELRCAHGFDLWRRAVDLSKIEELVHGLRQQSRIIYLCTNGVFMRKKMKDHLAATYSPEAEPLLKQLVDEDLISENDVETIRKGPKNDRPTIAPSKWVYWNVHVDGLEYTHDLIVEREGVFKECVAAIKMAKLLGYQVATNTTVYKETDVKEIEEMFAFLSSMEVDGHTISPGYDYDAAKKDMMSRLGKQPEDFFLTRAMTREKFADIEQWGQKFTIFGTPVYQEFLSGRRELSCSAWAIPTRNIAGWKAPCYLMTDGHYPSYQEMLEQVDWTKYGVDNGVARDPRCENCMVHCGFDPSGALGTDAQPGDLWKNIRYNFGAKPKPYFEGKHVKAFNGVTIGKGHLAEAKAAINPPAGSSCGSGDTSERDELLEKIAATKKN